MRVRLIVPDPEVAVELASGPDPLPSELWSSETRLDSPCIVLLSHPPQPAQLEALRRASAPVLLQTTASGVDHLRGLVPQGVTVARAPELRSRATAEVALTLGLSALLEADRWQRVREQRAWQWLSPTPRIGGSTVFVLGRGPVGAACSELFRAVGAEVRGFGRSSPSLDEALADLRRCDLLVLALPLTAQTVGLIGESELARLHDGAVVVNVARAALIDNDALLREVTAGRLRAGLDVFDEEPLPPSSPWWSAPNVVLSPHVGGSVDVPPAVLAAIVRRQYALLEAKLSPENVVDATLYGW